LLDRLKRAMRSEPELTWLESEAPRIEVPPERETAPERRRRRARPEINGPLIFGGLIVLGLFAVVLFGPVLAPENPYLAGQRSSMIVDGQFITPPFPPSAELPLGTDQWGRDILSMLLYGTRNTMVACLFIAMARVLLGSTLGMVAGWNEGGVLDRLVMGLVEWTTALPTLLTGMILILALGIQRGITIFIVALCFVGWAEIAQYIRSEFMVVRRKPFIEGARVIGLNGLGIAVRHILPNVLPSLVVIAVLEMGAVLMILGELGFIGVFIGGGSWIQVGDTAVANIPDIPEWGAMMAGAREFARSQTWMVFYPALAFFLAVLGFNLLGEGMRRIVQKRGVSTAFILSKRMVLVIAAITLATAYIVTHVGPAPSYAGLAQRFDAEEAMVYLRDLTTPEMSGRQAGTPTGAAAAAYIADRFAEYGLETIHVSVGYQLPMTSRVVAPIAQPELALVDQSGRVTSAFTYRVDFGVDIGGHGGSGQVEAPIALLTFSKQGITPQEYKGLDLRGRVAMYVGAGAPPGLNVEVLLRGAVGILVVTDDITPRLQLSAADGEYLLPPSLPIIRISTSTANALLAADGLVVEQLASPSSGSAWQKHELKGLLRIRLSLSPVQEVSSDNVLAVFRGSDATLNKQLVIISAHYDGPGQQPDGTVLQQASQGASAIATMLEIARLWHERGFKPRRTVMFAAWTGGEWQNSGAHEYLSSQAPYSILEIVAVVNLNGLGRGTELIADGNPRLLDLLLRSAEASGLPARQGSLRSYPYQSAFRADAVTVGLSDSDPPVPMDDTAELVEPEQLGRAGQAINLALITLSREYDY